MKLFIRTAVTVSLLLLLVGFEPEKATSSSRTPDSTAVFTEQLQTTEVDFWKGLGCCFALFVLGKIKFSSLKTP